MRTTIYAIFDSSGKEIGEVKTYSQALDRLCHDKNVAFFVGREVVVGEDGRRLYSRDVTIYSRSDLEIDLSNGTITFS